MSNTVGIIQARMGSTRLKNKMSLKLDGTPVIYWVIKRVLKASLLDEIVLATSNTKKDDYLVNVAHELGVNVFRGSENDVLSRFIGAGREYNADTIIRICADNPFIDATEIDRLIDSFKKSTASYACNHQEKFGNKYADGFGAEAISFETLKEINALDIDDKYREHVTLYIYDNIKNFSVLAISPPDYLRFPEMRFDIDSKEDFLYLKKLIKEGVSIISSAKEIITIAREIHD